METLYQGTVYKQIYERGYWLDHQGKKYRAYPIDTDKLMVSITGNTLTDILAIIIALKGE